MIVAHTTNVTSAQRAPKRVGSGINDAARKLNKRVATAATGHRDAILWRTQADQICCASIGPHCRDLGVENSLPVRMEYRYKGRRAHSGEHYFAPVDGHRHFESFTERQAMMQIAYHYNRGDLPDIVAFASQPWLVVFDDARRAYPDLMAGLSDGTGVVFDVKLRKALTAKRREKFERCDEVCRRIGWNYVAVLEPERVVGFNIEKLAAYRHRRFAPSPETTAAVTEFCATERELGEVADWLTTGRRGDVVAGLLHLLWMRVLEPATLTVPLEWNVPVATSAFGRPGGV